MHESTDGIFGWAAASASTPSGFSSPGFKSLAATQKWNLIVGIFYDQMPLKRHWKLLWPHDNSFTGKEAIDFLLLTLPKVVHDTQIHRINCFQLLQRFLKEGLIFSVKNPKEKKLSDDGTIYKFNVERIENELYKTAHSSLIDTSSPRYCPPRPYASCDDVSGQDENMHIFKRVASSFRSPKVKKSNVFASFRRKPPVFMPPPPPTRPPSVYQQTPPPTIYKRTPLVDIHQHMQQNQLRKTIIPRKRVYTVNTSPIPNKIPRRN